MRRHLLALFAAGLTATASSAAFATETLRVYGPGGPLPAMKEAAAVFGQAHGIDLQVTAGRTPQWIDLAKSDADLIFSGSEVMMSDFITAIPEIDPATVHPLFCDQRLFWFDRETPAISPALPICLSRVIAFWS
jgi:accessory colonization factor AcfC